VTRSKSIHAYNDIATQLRAARELGGAVLEFERFGQAVSWRARAYTYRSVLRAAEAERLQAPPGTTVPTPWDDMILQIDVAKKEPKVKIQFGVLIRSGKMRPLEETDLDPNVQSFEPPPLVDPTLPVPGDTDEDILAKAVNMLGKDK
jgi:hypothetical protein